MQTRARVWQPEWLLALPVAMLCTLPAGMAAACPFAVAAARSGLDDGCANAPAGQSQYPTLLARYGSRRPPWDVAGVDYPVGIPAGTVLIDWQSIADPNLAIDTHSGMIRCIGHQASVTLSGIDFSRHGGAFIYNGAGGCAAISISRSYFGCPASAPGFTFVQDQNGAAVTILYSKFDGSGCWTANGAAGGFATFLSLSSAVVQFNWFLRSPQQVLDIGGSGSVDYRYNLLDDVAVVPGAHMNYLQFTGGGTSGPVQVEFNTSRQLSCGGAEGFQFYNNNTPAVLMRPVLAHNTMIAQSPLPLHCPQPNPDVVMSYMIHGTCAGGARCANARTALVGGGINTRNYFDTSGAYAAYYPGTMSPDNGWTSSGNIDMRTGAEIPVPR